MRNRLSPKLGLVKASLLAGAAAAAVVGPFSIGFTNAPLLEGSQTAAAPGKAKFEVAAIKLSAPPQMVGGSMMGGILARAPECGGGPGTRSPGRYSCSSATLGYMIRQAFGLKPYEIGPDVAASGPEYDVTAKIPPGATAEQVRIMMQNLLMERFKLTYHFEKKPMEVYELTAGEGGPKLKVSSPEMPPSENGRAPARHGLSTTKVPGVGASIRATDSTVEQLARFLSNQTGRPVLDATGLAGRFDFRLVFGADMPASDPPTHSYSSMSGSASVQAPMPRGNEPPLRRAIQQQLGLKLEQKKAYINYFVLDHVEKVPTEN